VELGETHELTSRHFVKIDALVSDILPLLCEHQMRHIEKPFNVFLAASDIYYRENFHSDILAEILRRPVFLSQFFSFLNQFASTPICEKNYLNPEIHREDGCIDILIKDSATKHCIIVENKINNAPDMERQMPRYLEFMRDQGFAVDGVFYLSLDGSKEPDKTTWQDDDKKSFVPLLFRIGAVNNHNGTEKTKDLCSGFLLPCLAKAATESEFSYLRQYTDLISYLGSLSMDKGLMKQFFERMKTKENFNNALSLRAMLNALPTFRRDRIRETFLDNKKYPFSTISPYSSNVVIFSGLPIFQNEQVKLDIISEESTTKVRFWIQEPKEPGDKIEKLLTDIGLIDCFSKESENTFNTAFSFPEQDQEMLDFIKDFLKRLGKEIGSREQ